MHRFETGDCCCLSRIGFASGAGPPANKQPSAALKMPEKPSASMADTFARPEIEELAETASESSVRRCHSDVHHMSAINTNITTEASRQAILKAIARARLWYEQLTTGEAGSISQLADMHGLSERFLHAQMKLVQLSPKSIESLMNRPESLPLSLGDLLKAIPLNWREQALNLSVKSA
jgi:hypothetical protein